MTRYWMVCPPKGASTPFTENGPKVYKSAVVTEYHRFATARLGFAQWLGENGRAFWLHPHPDVQFQGEAQARSRWFTHNSVLKPINYVLDCYMLTAWVRWLNQGHEHRWPITYMHFYSWSKFCICHIEEAILSEICVTWHTCIHDLSEA